MSSGVAGRIVPPKSTGSTRSTSRTAQTAWHPKASLNHASIRAGSPAGTVSMKRETPNSSAWTAKRSRSASGSRAAWPAEEPPRDLRLVVDRAGEVGERPSVAHRDVPVLGNVRLEVVDLGQERLGGALARVALGEQRRRLRAKAGKWVNLEGRHRVRTIPLPLCRKR